MIFRKCMLASHLYVIFTIWVENLERILWFEQLEHVLCFEDLEHMIFVSNSYNRCSKTWIATSMLLAPNERTCRSVRANEHVPGACVRTKKQKLFVLNYRRYAIINK